MRLLFIATCTVLWMACRPSAPELIPLPTEICVTTSHHNFPIPDATVYIKYNADTFPGYDQPAQYYDASFRTGKEAQGCLESVPEGKHWLVAFGYDSLHYPHNVVGSIPVEISLGEQPKFDTILYVTEKH